MFLLEALNQTAGEQDVKADHIMVRRSIAVPPEIYLCDRHRPDF